MTDSYNTGKGYAFVTLSSPNEAQDAISQLNGQEVFGQTLKVDMAKPGGGRGGRGGGRGRGFGGGRGCIKRILRNMKIKLILIII